MIRSWGVTHGVRNGPAPSTVGESVVRRGTPGLTQHQTAWLYCRVAGFGFERLKVRGSQVNVNPLAAARNCSNEGMGTWRFLGN